MLMGESRRRYPPIASEGRREAVATGAEKQSEDTEEQSQSMVLLRFLGLSVVIILVLVAVAYLLGSR